MEVLGLGADMKVDRTDVQKRFRRLLRTAHPDHGGESVGAAERIAELTEARELLLADFLGVITRPVREQRWWATRGGGAFRSSLSSSSSSSLSSSTPVHVSTVDEIAKSRVSVWSRQSDEVVERLELGTVLVGATLDNILEVIDGDLEAVVGASGKIWDHAPAVIIIDEAGGHFRDSHGGHRPDLGSGIYSNCLIDSALDRVIEG